MFSHSLDVMQQARKVRLVMESDDENVNRDTEVETYNYCTEENRLVNVGP